MSPNFTESVAGVEALHPITRSLSRCAFEARLEALLGNGAASCSQHALLYIRIDNLRQVNSVFGLDAGDALLRRMGARLQTRLRPPDFVARLDGDVYGVVLHRTSRQDALRIAEQMHDALSTLRFQWEGHPCRVEVAMGMAMIRPGSDALPEILQRAARACREARKSGAGLLDAVEGTELAAAQFRRWTVWGSRVAHALEEGRFHLHFQPIQLLRPGEGGAAASRRGEILLRMVAPDGALVCPGRFLAAAEHYHLMPVLDRWVVRNCIAGLALYRREQPAAPAPSLFINLSAAALKDEMFLEFLEDQFSAHGTPPAWVCFEIGEAAALDHFRAARRLIAGLRRLGCGVALDAFGGGLSSFCLLKQLPADYVKIHGSFVRRMAYDESYPDLVAGIHRKAALLGMATVAGCVESDDLLERLSGLGVHYAQGYAVARPKAWSWPELTDG